MSFRSLLQGSISVFLACALSGARVAQCELEIQELTPPDGQAGDGFGYRVERDGNVAVVAATFDDDQGWDAGSAYVYERDPAGDWRLAQKLLASDGAAGDYFAYSVGVQGKTVLVGAPYHDGSAADTGAVYVFERDQDGPDAWREVGRLTPSSAGAGAHFGYSLAVHGDRLLVGAPHHVQGVSGRAYLYRRDATSPAGWTLELEFTSTEPATAFEFGQDVTLGESTLAVSGSTESVPPYSNSYVVHVRERDAGGAGSWGEVTRISSPTGRRDLFAWEIVLDGKRLVAVAPAEWDLQTNALGALYLYERDHTGWNLARRIVSAQGDQGIFFVPDEVELHGDWLVASGSSLTSGGQTAAGALFVFGRNAGGADAWGEMARVADGDPVADAAFGLDLELEGDELVVGAPGAYFGALHGEVYVLDLTRLARATWRSDAAGVDLPVHHVLTRPQLGTTYRAEVDIEASGHARAVLLVFAERDQRVLAGGQVLLGRGLIGRMLRAGPRPRFNVALPNDPALCGLALVTQAALLGGGQPLALTNAQDLVLGAE